MRAILLLALLVLAGCGTPPSLGDKAYEFTEAFMFDGDELRERRPEQPGSDATAIWLVQQFPEDYHVELQTFSGAQYEALPNLQASYSCSDEDRTAVPGMKFTNVLASRTTDSDNHLWLVAHWDQKEEASDGGVLPGANDAAASVGLLLAMASQLDPEKTQSNIHIAFVDGEDGFEDCHPLAGSTYLASTLGDGNHRVLVLDMIGDPDARFIMEKRSVASDPDADFWLRTNAHEFGLAGNFVSTNRAITDDHVPFLDAGYKAYDLIDAGRETVFPPYWHTSGDTMENISASMLDRVGRLILAMVESEDYITTYV